MKYLFILTLAMLTVATAKPKFTDRQIASMTPRYFSRDHTAPKLKTVKIFYEGGERVYQVEIFSSRNRYNDDLGFAVSALATMGQYAKNPYDKFIIVMHYDLPGKAPDICEAKAKCTIDHVIHKRVEYNDWYKNCIHFRTT